MDLTELVKSIDIVEYISQYVDLEEKNGEYWGLSPFKNERTPSFSVRRENWSFQDFSSGLAGNVFTFTKYYFKCSAPEAVKKLEEYSGKSCSDSNTNVLQATKICKEYSEKERQTKQNKSTILPDDYMERFSNKPEKLEIWRDEGISDYAMNVFGVKYDSFSNRIVYPIRNYEGKIVNVGARTLDPMWKYKGLRKYSYYYQWGSLDVIYGLYENLKSIKEKNEIIIFEGAKSVMKAYSWGITNCGAALTSHLNPNQMKLLMRLGVTVVFGFDKDVDIRSDHNINKLKSYVPVYYIKDTGNLIGDKDSPVDKGEYIFSSLYNDRKRFR